MVKVVIVLTVRLQEHKQCSLKISVRGKTFLKGTLSSISHQLLLGGTLPCSTNHVKEDEMKCNFCMPSLRSLVT